MNPDLYPHFLDQCYELARKSPCVKARFGSMIVETRGDGSHQVHGYGYNRSPNPAYEDCATKCAGGIRVGCKSGTRLELCYATHAEQWALLEAGQKAGGATIFVAGFDGNWEKLLKDPSLPATDPRSGFYCSFCARLIWAANIKEVVMDTAFGPISFTPEEVWNASYGVADSIGKVAGA